MDTPHADASNTPMSGMSLLRMRINTWVSRHSRRKKHVGRDVYQEDRKTTHTEVSRRQSNSLLSLAPCSGRQAKKRKTKQRERRTQSRKKKKKRKRKPPNLDHGAPTAEKGYLHYHSRLFLFFVVFFFLSFSSSLSFTFCL